MDKDLIKKIFDEILKDHPCLAEVIANTYDEIGPYELEARIKMYE